MAKSTGNYILPGEIFTGNNTNISKAFSPSVARFFMLQAHYRSILDFTNDGLLASEKGFRITSYNVCYTKLLRLNLKLFY